MGKIKFRKPNMGIVMSEVILLAVWLFFGDKVVNVLNGLIGPNGDGEVNESVFKDAYEFLGLGTTNGVNNSQNGLLGIVALVLVVAILMNFITYGNKRM